VLLPKSILIIDDDMDMAIIFKIVFEKAGYNAISFTDPLLAIEHFKSNPTFYSLILTDLRMPNKSGIELANEIRKISTTVDIWLTTAFMLEDFSNDSRFKSAKINRIVEKPIKVSNLVKLVSNEIFSTVKSGQ
jgi:DNA-binding NtrC family response regulator